MAKIRCNVFNIPDIYAEKIKNTSITVEKHKNDEMTISFNDSDEQEIIKNLFMDVYAKGIGDVKTFVELNNKLITASLDNAPRKLYCFSHAEFDQAVEDNGWLTSPPPVKAATVSIVSYNPSEYDFCHYYYGDYNDKRLMNNFNLDVDDIGPFWWESKEDDLYDKTWALFEDYLTTHDRIHLEKSNAFYNCFRTLSDYTPQVLHVMNCEEAFNLMTFIEEKVKKDKVFEFYVHCGAGVSRSQAVVRYILDTYPEYNWKIRKDNPPQMPNIHILSMLKRAYRLTHKNI